MAAKKKPKSSTTSKWPSRVGNFIWRGSWWRKTLIIIVLLVSLWLVICYGVARWYVNKHSGEPLSIGTTFISNYAESFGLDPQQTLKAIFEELGIKQIRLVSYWKDIEITPGNYDFSSLDWQFDMAARNNAKVSLAIGLRQPRWPECHEPKWVDISAPQDQWRPQLDNYMTAVINRYKDNPALGSYQLENEFFMSIFGECKNFDRQRLVEEYNMVKKLDPRHPVIVSRSNNWIGLPLGQPRPDIFGISVYKRVWDSTFTKRYFEYPMPSWFYSTLAGWTEILTGKDMIIHELQAEAWAPNKKTLQEITVEEQYKSLNAKRMKDRIDYGVATGMRQINLWGAEWWYWLKVKNGDPSVWNTVKAEIKSANLKNQKIQTQ